MRVGVPAEIKSHEYRVAITPAGVHELTRYGHDVTLPYALSLANNGWREALRADPALALGLNTHDGAITNGPVAHAHGLEHRELADVLA